MTDRYPDSEYVCPLCGDTAPTRNDVYVHLQLNHRKSQICDALVEVTDPDRRELVADD